VRRGVHGAPAGPVTTDRQATTPEFEVVACRSCDARIIWARTTGDKAMPVNAEPSPDGNVELVRQGHRVIATVVTAATLFGPALRNSHFVTCPEADKWRGTRKLNRQEQRARRR
jgi:hypothetical protein